jgi:TolA-binding protein
VNDPERLGDKGGDDPGAALLRSAKRYRLSDKGRQRALAAVGLAVGATAVAGGKAAAEGVAAGTKMLGWVLAGVVGVAASVGGYVALAPGDRAPSVTRSASGAPPPQVRVEPPAPVVAVEETAVTAAPNVSASAAPRVAPSPAASRVVPPADLQAELTALDAASSAVARGDTARALAALDAYGRDFPRGSLAAEAMVLRAEALERAGRHADAVQIARAFVKRHPKSPLADRMRRIAGD